MYYPLKNIEFTHRGTIEGQHIMEEDALQATDEKFIHFPAFSTPDKYTSPRKHSVLYNYHSTTGHTLLPFPLDLFTRPLCFMFYLTTDTLCELSIAKRYSL